MPSDESSQSIIAIAVVEHDGKFLIGRRPAGSALAGYWEFPGGKVLPGESPREAAARECLEETGLAVSIGHECQIVEHQYEHSRLKLHFFAATPCQPKQKPQERFCWAPGEELGRYTFPPANASVLALLAGRFGETSRLAKVRPARASIAGSSSGDSQARGCC